MANYTGVRCPVCSKKFSSTDDIVVCPVCGAPHHRDCYAEKGACAFVDDHLNGKEWAPPPGEGPATGQPGGAGAYGDAGGESAAPKRCPHCAGDNPEENVFCQHCGQRLFAQEQRSGPGPGAGFGFPGGIPIDPAAMAYGGLKPDQEIDGVPVREVALYVGPNSMYYLPRFAAIDSARSALLPNFAAFFGSFLYFFYRKMYAIGTVLLLVFVVGLIPSFLYAREVMPSMLAQMGWEVDGAINQQLANSYANWANIARIVQLVVGVTMAFFANRIYYVRAMRAIHALRDDRPEGADEGEYRVQMTAAGGVNQVAVIVTACVVAVAFCIVSFVIAQNMIV